MVIHMMKIADFWRLKGGWEGWLHVELGSTMARQLKYHGCREEGIYEEEGRVDLWFEPALGLGPDIVTIRPDTPDCVAIELKCDNQTTSPQKAFIKDVKKVLEGVKASHVGRVAGSDGRRCRGTHVFCVAVTTRESDLYGLESHIEREWRDRFTNQRFYHQHLWAGGSKFAGPDGRESSYPFPMDLWLIWWSHYLRSQV